MKTQVTFRHLKSEPELHDAAIDAAASFEKYHDGIISTDIIFSNDHSKSVEFTVRVKGDTLVAKEDSGDFMKSLNEASDKMIRQLRKLKTRRYKI